MRYLLDKLHTELSEVELSASAKNEEKKMVPTIVSEIFGGVLQSDVSLHALVVITWQEVVF